MNRYFVVMLFISLMTGCQSALITPSESSWPSAVSMQGCNVHSFNVLNGSKENIPFLMPIQDRGDMRFRHEASVTLNGLDNNKFPVFTAPGDKIVLQLNMEDLSDTDLGDMAKRWCELFEFDKTIKKDLDRGSISVDQVGYSIWVRGPDGNWVKVDRAQFRSSRNPIAQSWSRLRAPSR